MDGSADGEQQRSTQDRDAARVLSGHLVEPPTAAVLRRSGNSLGAADRFLCFLDCLVHLSRAVHARGVVKVFALPSREEHAVKETAPSDYGTRTDDCSGFRLLVVSGFVSHINTSHIANYQHVDQRFSAQALC